jgi:hypothetical protein
MHIKLGHIGTDDKFVPQQMEALPSHSSLPLYSLILQHNGVDLTNKIQVDESPEGIPNDNGFLDVEDADDEDASNTSGSDDEEKDELTLRSYEEQEECCGFRLVPLSKEHRLQILQQNTTRWSTLYVLPLFL